MHTLKHLSLRNKFRILFILFSFIPLTALALFSYSYIANSIRDQFYSGMEAFIGSVNYNLDQTMADIEDMSQVISFSREIQEILSKTEMDRFEKIDDTRTLQSVIRNVSLNKKYINTILIFNRHFNVFSNDNAGTYDTESIAVRMADGFYTYYYAQPWCQMLSVRGGGLWFGGSQFGLNNDNLVIFGRVINGMSNLSQIGVLAIGIDKQVFHNMFGRIKSNENYNVCILNGNDLIYSNSPEFAEELLASTLPEQKSDEENSMVLVGENHYLITSVQNKQTGWRILCAANEELLTWQTDQVRRLTLIIATVSIVLATLGVFLMIDRITAQWKILSYTVNRLKNKQSIDGIEFDEEEEGGRIGNELLDVVKQNRELNLHLYDATVKKKEAELIALQSQIKPHFLYNTLNSIYMMAEKQGAIEIGKIAMNLSKLFQFSFNQGGEITTLNNEMEQVLCYVNIQKMRYPGKFTLSLDLPEKLGCYPILKLSLQPLVENAIYHGLECKHGQGHITIRVKEVETDILISVEDDGIGFQGPIRIGESGALRNIDDRTKLRYGADYGIQIQSEADIGTIVSLTIKKEII